MNTIRNTVLAGFLIFSSIYSEQNSNDSLISTKFPGLVNSLLPCWKATYIQYPDSNWIPQCINSDWNPQYMEAPLFNIHFKDTCHLASRYEGGSEAIQPNLILCFYPISQKDTLIQIIDRSGGFSWCIPIQYDETKKYFIITSPCFRNNGCMSDGVRRYFDPQDSALHVFFSGSLSVNKLTAYRNSFTKSIHISNSMLSKQFLLNGRVKTGGGASLLIISVYVRNIYASSVDIPSDRHLCRKAIQ